MTEPIPILSPKAWLEEEFWTPEGQQAKRSAPYSSKRELIKKMNKRGGFTTLCLYDLQKKGEHTGEVFGQIRTLKILDKDPNPKEEAKSDEAVG